MQGHDYLMKNYAIMSQIQQIWYERVDLPINNPINEQQCHDRKDNSKKDEGF